MLVALYWIRHGWSLSGDFENGYIRGFLNGVMAEPWEVMYVENIARARARGVSA